MSAADEVARPARPYCAHCAKPIHADPTSPTGYRHAGSMRVACADGHGNATPTRT